MEERSRFEPLPSLSKLSSFESFVRKYGEPNLCLSRFDRKKTKDACFDFSPFSFLALTERYEAYRENTVSFCPAICSAVWSYDFIRRHIRDPSNKHASKGELLDNILGLEVSSKKIVKNLSFLMSRGFEMPDSDGFERAEYIHDILLAIDKAVLLDTDFETPVTDGRSAKAMFDLQKLSSQLNALSAAAKFILDSHPNPPGGRRRQLDPALPFLAEDAAVIWEAMTGRSASTSERHIPKGSEVPEFVEFVAALVAAGGGPPPTLKTVRIALRR